MPLPITIDDVRAAADRLRPFLAPTALRRYPGLDALVGHGISVLVKHENHQPTQSFKVRNGLSSITALDAAARGKGVIAATTGNHGQGLAWAGAQLGVQVTIVVPEGNNPSKNAAIRALGAELIETGATYDLAAEECGRICAERGMTLVHSTNHREVLTGAGTMTLELLEQAPDLDAVVIALGGGSQSVGAITVARALRPSLEVYAVQSSLAPGQHSAWSSRAPVTGVPSRTFAEGIATGRSYEMTFETLREGLTDFVLVDDDAIAEAMRVLIRETHNLPEGSGAAGFAGLRALAPRLAGRRVAVVMCGGNASERELATVIAGGTPTR